MHLPRLQSVARAAAQLDVLACFAANASRRGWCRPQFAAEPLIEIEAGRHPVVEDQVEHFIANPAAPVSTARRLLLITGPNMGGKSTYMRQVALIVLLAHVGAYVPASSTRGSGPSTRSSPASGRPTILPAGARPSWWR